MGAPAGGMAPKLHVALGVVTSIPCHLRSATTATTQDQPFFQNNLEWRCVVSSTYQHKLTDRVLLTPCLDTANDIDAKTRYAHKQVSCACKTNWWFLFALRRFRLSNYIAKTEDDTVLHVPRLILSLDHAWRPFHRDYPLMWFSRFQWARFNGTQGKFCADGNALLNQPRPNMRTCFPFATGGLDVRSIDMIEKMSECANAYQLERVGACDAVNGYVLTKCTPQVRTPLLLHLAHSMFCSSFGKVRNDTIVLHNQKMKPERNWKDTSRHWGQEWRSNLPDLRATPKLLLTRNTMTTWVDVPHSDSFTALT